MQISTYGISLDPEELRDIIKGVTEFRKCPDCQGEGNQWTLHYILADDLEDNEQFRDVSAQFAADFDENNLPSGYSFGECFLYDCETCGSVGYIPICG